MTEQEAVRSLAALAQQTRLQIFRLLVVTGTEGMNPSRLSEELGVPSSALSFHLKELTHANLITQERDGRNLIYRASFSNMNDLLSFMTANCCAGDTCEVQDSTAACTNC